MASTREQGRPPMAEPGRRDTGASTGGIARNADGGLADALQRSSERGDDDATGAATTGEGLSGGTEPRLDLGGKNEPGSASGADVPIGSAGASATPRPDRAQTASRPSPRHEGGGTATRNHADTEPPDEGPLESLGRAIGEPLTGADDPGVPGDRDGAGRKR